MITEESLRKLNEIGLSLSREKDIHALLKKILLYAKSLTNADGGTLYTITENRTLHFEIVTTDSLNYFVETRLEKHTLPFEDVPLVCSDGHPNKAHIVATAVNEIKAINVLDIDKQTDFDFSGARAFDKKIGYKTISLLTVPICDHESRVVAAIQLINARDEKKKVRSFTKEDEEILASLSSQAGIAIANHSLIAELRNLFNAFVKVISEAIDEKSPMTGNHGKRVPILACMIAEALNGTKMGPFKDIRFSQEDLNELELAACLHDCGKIITPSHIMEKRNKLETITDTITEVMLRFEIYELKHHVDLSEEKAFVKRCNENSEIIDDVALAKLKDLQEKGILTEEHFKHLSVKEGNLTDEERAIMQKHVETTFHMLKNLPFPGDLKHVPEIAAAHHERVDGKGYPKGLKKEEMLLQARILAIADVFEALSAPDRPYKKPLPLSLIYKIMQQKCDEGHLDEDLFHLFLEQGVGLKYGKLFLSPNQLDV